MSDTRFAPVDAPKTQTAPPKRWFNWWRHCHDPHAWRNTGAYPSAEIAEQKASEDLSSPQYQLWLYLGAFPAGEAP